jgi:hypothetical protein
MTQLTPTVEDATLSLRSPATVMDLERLGSFSPTRLSFARRLTRLMFEQQWQVSRTQFELDENGHGFAVYCLQTPAYRYHVVVFSRHLEDAQRTDRVIAEAWDLTFCLLEGEVDAELMSALSANVPLQEAGRQHPRLLVISRANRSVRAFATVSAALASGQQPDIDQRDICIEQRPFTATVSSALPISIDLKAIRTFGSLSLRKWRRSIC